MIYNKGDVVVMHSRDKCKYLDQPISDEMEKLLRKKKRRLRIMEIAEDSDGNQKHFLSDNLFIWKFNWINHKEN